MKILDKLVGILNLKKEQMTILVIGLNNSGKSTIVNHFKYPEKCTVLTVPTFGFTIEQFRNQGIIFTAFDMSGAGRYRSLWEHHFKNCQGIIYVIDSSDLMRLAVVKDELDIMLRHPDLASRRIPILFYGNKMDCPDALSSVKIAAVVVKDELDIMLRHPDLASRRIPILFYGNKMDCPDALSSVKIAAALGLETIKEKPWQISSTNALSGEGLEDGVQWLVEQIRLCVIDVKKTRK